MKRLKQFLLISINVILFIYLGVWLSNNIKYEVFLNTLSSVDLSVLAIVMLLNIIILFPYANRLKLILNSNNFKVPYKITVVGYGLNIVLPFKLGEIGKILYAKRVHGIQASKFAIISFIEKLFDVNILFIILLFSLLFSTKNTLASSGIISSVFVFLIFSWLLIFSIRKKNIKNLLKTRIVFKIKVVKKFIFILHREIKQYSFKTILKSSIIIWFINILIVYLIFRLISPIEISILDITILIVMLSFAISIPSLPANLGVVEGIIVWYLITYYSIPNEKALLIALIYHIGYALPYAIIAAYFIISSKLKIKNTFKGI